MSIVFAAMLLVAGISALPHSDHHALSHQLEGYHVQRNPQPYVLGPVIAAAFRDYIRIIEDPYKNVGQQVFHLTLPDGSFFVNGVIDRLCVVGLSNIIVNSITTPLIPNRVDFDVIAPLIQLWADSATLDAKFASYIFSTIGGGWAAFENVRIVGRASISLFWPIQVSNVNVVVTIGAIRGNAVGTVRGIQYTECLNELLNKYLLRILTDEHAELNRVSNHFLEQYIADIINF